MNRPTYHTKRAVPVVVGAGVGAILASMWFAACILAGSRIGEAWAGTRRQSIGDFREVSA